MAKQGPTMRRRRLGSELRTLREHAGLTIEVVAERTGFSTSKVSRIETGHIGASTRAVTGMLTLYDAVPDKVDEVIRLARQAKQTDWWHLYGSVLTSAFVEFEAAAARIMAYDAQVVPGLLQTEAYARHVIRAARPDITRQQLDRRIEVRSQRQKRLDPPHPVDYWVILDEGIFGRSVDDKAVMREQMDRLIEVAGRPTVTLQVLPLSIGMHAAMDGTFAILEYDERQSPDVVFAENAAGGLFLELKEHHERYTAIFNRLRASALSPGASLEHLRDRRAAM
jgi:transcriptional regulator with XRE-family HTH domain